MEGIKDYILGFLGGTLGCSRREPPPELWPAQPEPVAPSQPPQHNAPIRETATPTLDTHYLDEYALIRAYEERENGCVAKEDIDAETLAGCVAYYAETLAAYEALRAGTQGAEQLKIIEGRISEFNNYVELTTQLENLKTAFRDLRTYLETFVKAKEGLNEAVKKYKDADSYFYDAIASVEATSFDQNDPALMNIDEVLSAAEKVFLEAPKEEVTKVQKKDGFWKGW